MSILIVIFLVAAAILSILALVDFPPGSSVKYVAVALLLVVILTAIVHFGGKAV